MPSPEIWDLYNGKREKLGREHVRGERIPDGMFHLVVHVWVRDSNGEYLLSRRAPTRPTYPLLLECVGGSVLKGESSLEGAMREVYEEIGIRPKPSLFRHVHTKLRDTINGVRFGDIMDVYILEYDGDADLAAAPTDEVSETVRVTREELNALWQAGKLVPTLDYFFRELSLDS